MAKLVGTIIAAIALAALSVPTCAQVVGPKRAKAAQEAVAAQKAAKRKAEEQAYKSALDRIPEPEKKRDPWGNMR